MTVFLVRGLPGSGKTTFAHALNLEGTIAADDFFVDEDGKYNFDPSKIADAHQWCQQETKAFLAAGQDVAVHNTFSTRWEIEPYLQMAVRHGARVHVVDVYDGGLADEQLHERNSHGVPLHTIVQMRSRWEHDWKSGNPLPPWERS